MLSYRNFKIGILGCGAIGSGIAKRITKDYKKICSLSGFYDHNESKVVALAKTLGKPELIKNSLNHLLKNCDLMVEAVNALNTRPLIRQALLAKRDVLAMSTGKLLNAQTLFKLATTNRCSLLLPSGAIAGIDAIKSASLVNIKSITLTTRKPISGFLDNPYLKRNKIDVTKIKKETVLFEGPVDSAIQCFPQNINVAATIALAAHNKSKLTIRILTSPDFTCNSHEIEMVGDSGRIVTRTDNVICPDNPKTSYLAVLSGIRTLVDHCIGIKIGT